MKMLWITLLLGSLVHYGSPDNNTGQNDSISYHQDHKIHLVEWKWSEYGLYLIVPLFIIIACGIKTLYHHLDCLVQYIPESIVLIVFGTAIGCSLMFSMSAKSRNATSYLQLDPTLFFLILLPPIMLEASYSLYDRAFIDNIGSIMHFAVTGTVLNFFIIGFGMALVNSLGLLGVANLTMIHCLIFGSFIVAVDPVAVLSIFSEIGVDQGLYYIVFGESLLNDAVTVVLYNMMSSISQLPAISAPDIAMGIFSFFTVSIGGLLIGVLTGALCCIITRFTYSSKVVEPLVTLICAYLSYVLSHLLGWSGLIAIIACGLVQAAYSFQNTSRKALITLKYSTKMLASVAEAIIFVYLGIELVNGNHIWHWGFAMWSIAFCLAARFVVTIVSCCIINWLGRLQPFKWTEQFILGFGGLRGAVAFALCTLVSEPLMQKQGVKKELFVTTTLFIIMFTCIIIGIIMKPLVRCLRIRLEEEEKLSVLAVVITHMTYRVNSGIEEILGVKRDHYLRDWFAYLDYKYIRPILQRNPTTHDQRIWEMYLKVSMQIHSAGMQLNEEKAIQKMAKLPSPLAKKMSYGNLPSVHSFSDLTTANTSLNNNEYSPGKTMPRSSTCSDLTDMQMQHKTKSYKINNTKQSPEKLYTVPEDNCIQIEQMQRRRPSFVESFQEFTGKKLSPARRRLRRASIDLVKHSMFQSKNYSVSDMEKEMYNPKIEQSNHTIVKPPPSVDEVEKMMQMAMKASKPFKLSRSKSSDNDLERQLRDVNIRAIRGIEILHNESIFDESDPESVQQSPIKNGHVTFELSHNEKRGKKNQANLTKV